MRVVLLFAAAVCCIACKKSTDGTGTTGNPATASTQLNVGYGTDPLQKMDIYLPAGRSADSTKLMFLVHGGGWTEGDKADFTASVGSLQLRFPGYAFANINYRLEANGANLFPAQENDVKAAADFIFNKRMEYGISTKWVFVGASAGGHLAMLQAYKYNSPVKAAAVVSFFGPSDLTSLYNSGPLTALLLLNVTGSIPTLNPGIYQQSSPLNFITAQSPPTIVLQGGADLVVPPQQSTMVKRQTGFFGRYQSICFLSQ